MTAYKISKEAYEYHYDKGFTGPDAMGWDPNLQYAWSRIGAAKTCGVAFDADGILKQLISAYGHDKLTHTMIGIDFHHAQSMANAGFCTPERIKEAEATVPGFAGGTFPKPFKAGQQ